MKLELQRIEATLTQIKRPSSLGMLENNIRHGKAERSRTSCSFQIAAVNKLTTHSPIPSEGVSEVSAVSSSPMTLNLPKFKPVNFSNHRHATNPALTVGLLREIEVVVVKWQQELRQVSKQIHDLYQEGPIVDGWLESIPHPNATEEHTPLSHLEITRLLDSVQELLNASQPTLIAHESPRAGYRLCRLDPNGQVQCRSCAQEQVPELSLAIARYQKLRQLLARQQHLETRLNQLTQALVGMRSGLQD